MTTWYIFPRKSTYEENLEGNEKKNTKVKTSQQRKKKKKTRRKKSRDHEETSVPATMKKLLPCCTRPAFIVIYWWLKLYEMSEIIVKADFQCTFVGREATSTPQQVFDGDVVLSSYYQHNITFVNTVIVVLTLYTPILYGHIHLNA